MIRIISLAFTLLASPAAAQTCADRATIVRWLAEDFGQVPNTVALTHDDQVQETFVSPTTGTWTMALTTPGGETCLVAAGQAFASLVPVVGEVF